MEYLIIPITLHNNVGPALGIRKLSRAPSGGLNKMYEFTGKTSLKGDASFTWKESALSWLSLATSIRRLCTLMSLATTWSDSLLSVASSLPLISDTRSIATRAPCSSWLPSQTSALLGRLRLYRALSHSWYVGPGGDFQKTTTHWLAFLSNMIAVRCLNTSLVALSTMTLCSLEYARLNSCSICSRPNNSWLIMPFTNCVPRSEQIVIIGIPCLQTWLKSARAHGRMEVSLIGYSFTNRVKQSITTSMWQFSAKSLLTGPMVSMLRTLCPPGPHTCL